MVGGAIVDEVDSLELLVLVDNATDTLSSTPSHVESEGAGLMRRGVRMMGGKCLCCAAHGLSCLITVERGGVRRTMLFDTGRRNTPSSATSPGSAPISRRSRRSCCRTATGIMPARCCWR